MKSKYLLRQYVLKTLTLCGLIAALIGVIRFCLVIFAKPENQIVFTDYSQIILQKPNCESITTDTVIGEFPLAILYDTSFLHSDAVADDGGVFESKLKIIGAEKIFLTLIGEDFRDRGQSQIIEDYGNITFSITASILSADSASEPSEFGDLLSLMPSPYTESNFMYEDPPEVPGYFDWIESTPSRYKVGFCGENLAFNPEYNAASMTNLFDLGMEITTLERNAYSFAFRDVSSIKINGHLIPKNQKIIIRVILPSQEQSPENALTPVITMISTGLSDPHVKSIDSSTHVIPGMIQRGASLYEKQTQNTSVLGVAGNNKLFLVDSPKGWWSTGYTRINIPDTTNQVILTSEIGTVNFLKDNENSTSSFSNPTIVTTIFNGSNLSLLRDGTEVFFSYWDRLAPELQGAYLAAIVAIFTAIASYVIQKLQSIMRFISWQFSLPVYVPPVILSTDAHIFKLINGKTISGIMKPIEGRSTYRVFVLTEVREWDKDNWSEVLPTEVRVPQNQIEMYYKAHP